MRHLRSERGDTIVEVLIAIAVIGSVLGSAYAIVSRNTQSYQQVNEHTEALKIAEGQLERLRNVDNVTQVPFTGSFCFKQADGAVQATTPCKFGVGDRYDVIVNNSSNVFEAVVTWVGINGGTDKVSLSYRVYP